MKNTSISFQIIPKENILIAIPFLQELGNNSISETTLKERLLEMATQNYKCLGIYNNAKIIGVCGMWFQTRHYAGKSVEIDHVIISKEYQRKGIGKLLMEYVYEYAKKSSCNWVELNTYVHNFPSHKFYYNEGFIAKGYHFVKEL